MLKLKLHALATMGRADIGRRPDAGKIESPKEKGAEEGIVRWCHNLWCEFRHILGDSRGQGGP